MMVRATGSLTGSSGVANTFNGDMTFAADVTNARIYNSNPTTANAVFTVNQLVGFRSAAATKGASSTITTHIGFLADSSMSQATTSYGFYGDLAAGYNIYIAGSAPSYISGGLRIGTATATVGGAVIKLEAYGGRSIFTDNSDNFALGFRYGPGTTMVWMGATSTGDLQFSTAGGGPLLSVQQTGNCGVGTNSPAVKLDVNGNAIRIQTSSTPVNGGSPTAGNVGEIRWDANYLYVCTATNTWKRTALSTF
jgi:hypothetical protein